MKLGIPASWRLPCVVTLLLLLSLVVRLPLLHRPLSADHEWLPAHVLLTMRIWNTGGLAASHFALPVSFPNSADRHIEISHSPYVRDKNGTDYFISFPPLGFLLPHILFRITAVTPSLEALRVYGVLLHCIAAIMLFVLVRRILPDVSPRSRNVCALIALQLYLFAPLALYGFCNNYFPISAVQPLLLAALLALDAYLYGSGSRGGALAVFAIAGLAGAYTDWQMHLLLATVVIVGWASRDRQWSRIAWLAAGLLAGSTVLLILHYSTMSGFTALWSALSDRFVQRSGFFPAADGGFGYYSARTYRMLARSLVRGYGPTTLFMAMLASAVLIFIGVRRSAALVPARARSSVILLLGPAAAYHILLFDHAAWHNYATLPLLAALSVSTAVITFILLSFAARTPTLSVSTGWLMALCIGCTAISAFYFAFQYYPAGKLYQGEIALATFVRQTTKPSDRLFIRRTPSLDFINPIITLYSGRNIGLVDGPADAVRQLQNTHGSSGIVMEVDNEGKVSHYVRLGNNAERENP